MWRNLGANLDEHNAERTAGTLESGQLVYKSVNRDCYLKEQHFSRDNPKEEEAVHQIISDLLSNGVFIKKLGHEKYSAFPKFKRDLMDGLDYRDLNKNISIQLNKHCFLNMNSLHPGYYLLKNNVTQIQFHSNNFDF